MKTVQRRTSKETLKKIYNRTLGVCHFCGDELIFDNYGKKDVKLAGNWEIDHVKQIAKGGSNSINNKLAICYQCNRTRWDYAGRHLRYLINLGRIGAEERRKKSRIGLQLHKLYVERKEITKKRRENIK